MEWISVKNELPNDKQEVVFKGHFPLECAGFFERSESGYEFFHLSKFKKIYSIYGVTHWMPLPSPPEKQDN